MASEVRILSLPPFFAPFGKLSPLFIIKISKIMTVIMERFKNNLKSIPLEIGTIKRNKDYKGILDVINLIETKETARANSVALDLLEKGMAMTEKNKKNAPLFFLIISEIPKISKKIRDFAIDAMLVAEKDFYGEYRNLKELKRGFNKIKKAIIG
ncbi:hypothetical protein KKB71_02105 [Patescibacteria group bacterium]|nr:hypothetical protein [Patescibacteria group bacterium]